MKRYLITLLLLTSSAYGQTTITLTRDGKQVYATAEMSEVEFMYAMETGHTQKGEGK